VPGLHAERRSVYFLPDRILVRDRSRYADIAYAECGVSATATRFIEEDAVLSDAIKVGTTWKYVNVDGGPDRRYKDNRQIPIMRYGELSLSTDSGFRFVWQTSRPDAIQTMAASISAMMPKPHSPRNP
jgi:hypothetical protein